MWQAIETYPLILPLLSSVFLMQDVNDGQNLQAIATHVFPLLSSVFLRRLKSSGHCYSCIEHHDTDD